MANYVDVIANVMPWAGSLIPATLTYQNVQKNLGFDTGPALMIAAVVEGLGFVTVTTALDLYELRRAENKATPQAWGGQDERGQDGAFWISLAGALVYLVVVLMVNSILDGGDLWHKLTLGLLSIFGVLGGLMVALRKHLGERLAALGQAEFEREQRIQDEQRKAAETIQHINAERAAKERDALEYQRRIEDEARAHQRRIDEEERERKFQLKIQKLAAQQAENAAKVAESSVKVSENSGKVPESSVKVSGAGESFRKFQRWPDVPAEERLKIAGMTYDQVMAEYNVEERSAYNWIEKARREYA